MTGPALTVTAWPNPAVYASIKKGESELHYHLSDGRRVPMSAIVDAAERLLQFEQRLVALEARA